MKAGALEWHNNAWRVVVRLPDGKRVHIPMPGIAREDEVVAREVATQIALKARGAVPEQRGETVAEYAARWYAVRESQGVTAVRSDRGALREHVFPIIGSKPLRAVTREAMRQVVESLDGKVRSDAIAWKTAINTWAAICKLFADACNSKTRSLVVLEVNPCDGVDGPDRGQRKSKQYLYPSEFIRLAACDDVPLAWRELYTLGVYTGLRAGELVALDWPSVDLQRGVILINKAADRFNAHAITAPKNDEGRRIPIELNLMPLLHQLHDRSGGRGPVARNGKLHDHSHNFRLHLRRAGVDRAELFERTPTSVPITFHDMRATYLTWLAMRGEHGFVVQMRAGHRNAATTQFYLREAENLRDVDFGQPFPALPNSLTPDLTPDPKKHQEMLQKQWPLPDLNRTTNTNESPQNVTDTIEGQGSENRTRTDSLALDPDPLAEACRLAAIAGQWEVVASLAEEIRKRRSEAKPALKLIK